MNVLNLAKDKLSNLKIGEEVGILDDGKIIVLRVIGFQKKAHKTVDNLRKFAQCFNNDQSVSTQEILEFQSKIRDRND